MNTEPNLEQQLTNSLAIAFRGKAVAMMEAATVAAQAIASCSKLLASIHLGAGFEPGVVRAFAEILMVTPRIQLNAGTPGMVEVIEYVEAYMFGVRVCVQCSRPATSDDVAKIIAQKRQQGLEVVR